nr:MAG TPA: hypothetical protein [Caudoviricetes sp.]
MGDHLFFRMVTNAAILITKAMILIIRDIVCIMSVIEVYYT